MLSCYFQLMLGHIVLAEESHLHPRLLIVVFSDIQLFYCIDIMLVNLFYDIKLLHY